MIMMDDLGYKSRVSAEDSVPITRPLLSSNNNDKEVLGNTSSAGPSHIISTTTNSPKIINNDDNLVVEDLNLVPKRKSSASLEYQKMANRKKESLLLRQQQPPTTITNQGQEENFSPDPVLNTTRWMRNSIIFLRRQTLLELERRKRNWNRLKSSEWSCWGKFLFLLGLLIVIWCVCTLVWKLAFIDFYLYQLREDKQFMKSDFQRMLQIEGEDSHGINYEPIIKRTCSTDNFKFIISLIVCCIASALGLLLICCGLAGVTVQVEERIDEELLQHLKNLYTLEQRYGTAIAGKAPDDISQLPRYLNPIYTSYQTLYDGGKSPPPPPPATSQRNQKSLSKSRKLPNDPSDYEDKFKMNSTSPSLTPVRIVKSCPAPEEQILWNDPDKKFHDLTDYHPSLK